MPSHADITPGPVPMPIGHEKSIPVYMPANNGGGNGDNFHFMSRWWKEVVAICVGLAAVGSILWVLGKQFFVTRDEWTEQTVQISNTVMNTSNQIANISESLREQKTTLKETSKTVGDIKDQLTKIELLGERRYRSR